MVKLRNPGLLMIVPNPFSFRTAIVRIKKPGYRKRRTELHAYPFYLDEFKVVHVVRGNKRDG